jgi:endoglucanase
LRYWIVALGSAAFLAAVSVALATPSARRAVARARTAAAQQCSDPYPATRDPTNPLDLSTPPGLDPLNGAQFFVDGPRHGAAAGAIASLLGVDPKRYPDDYSWSRFKNGLKAGRFAQELRVNPVLRYQVNELEKIADQPEAQRFSVASGGGGPGAVFGQVQKLLCKNLMADPGTIPVFTTYFAHPVLGGCATQGQIGAATPAFRRRVDEVAAGTGRRPAVYLLELDAFGSSACMAKIGSLGAYERLIRYEVETIGGLPHTVVYVEAGYSDANSPSYTARALNAVGVSDIRGFFTNDTHMNWTINEVRWAEQVSRLTHGAHFIVNTAQNGDGPKRNPHPTTQGNEDLCNPPGRALGPLLTTATGFPNADAFMWTHVPGNSSGPCRGGPSPGTFWPTRAIDLATHANGRLGPGYASDPY